MNIHTRFTLQYAASILLAVSATGCFTGIESTPKITANEKDLAKISGGESNLLSDIRVNR